MDTTKKTNSPKKKSSAKVLKASAVAGAPQMKKSTAPAARKPASTVTPEQRMKMVQEAAYYRAEKHGFKVDPQANWLAAEAEVDAILARKARK
jgi:hypothetical protein